MGRTVHLLKQKSKPNMQERKRRKIQLMATPQQYKGAAEERKQDRGDADMLQAPSSS